MFSLYIGIGLLILVFCHIIVTMESDRFIQSMEEFDVDARPALGYSLDALFIWLMFLIVWPVVLVFVVRMK